MQINTHILENKIILNKIAKSLMLWLFIFDISFKNISTLLSSRKLIILILLLYYIYINKFNIKLCFEKLKIYLILNKKLIIFLVYLGLYSYLILILKHNNLSNNSAAINRLWYLLITILGGTFFVQNVFKHLNEFIQALIYAILIGAISSLLQFFFVPVKVFYETVFAQSGNCAYTTYYRAIAIGCEGALLSLILFIGFTFSLYLIIRKIHIYRFGFIALLLFITTLLAGKTGFLMEIALLLIFVIFIMIKKVNIRTFFFYVMIVFAVSFLLYPIIGIIFSRNEWLGNAINRTTQIFRIGLKDESIQDLLQMFENLKFGFSNFIYGSGITYGKTYEGILFINDSGYIKSIFGYGILNAILFYSIITSELIKKIRKIPFDLRELKGVLFILLITFLFCELKEPFLLKSPLIFIFITIESIISRGKEANEDIICN